MAKGLPAGDRMVERPEETTIRYSVTGPPEGPTLVLIHGWGCKRAYFDDVVSHLPAGLRAVAVDLAEHGDSRSRRTTWTMEEFARDVAAVLSAESITQCVVVGHSLGGAVAVEVGRLLPDVVTHVVVLDALHYLGLFPAMDDSQAEATMRPFHDDFAVAVRALVEGGSPEGFSQELIDSYFGMMVKVRQPAGTRAIEGLVRWNMEHALSETTQPITAFAVRALLASEAVERFGDRIDFVPVDLGSHHFPAESPKETAKLLTSLIGV
jgi:pimeloyl-ACP methyl ester carboxylesterase